MTMDGAAEVAAFQAEQHRIRETMEAEALAEAERVEKSTPTYRLLYRQVVALERIIELLERQNPAPHPWLGKS